MSVRPSSFFLRVILCCGSFLVVGPVSRADTFAGTESSSPIYASIPVISGDNLEVTVTSPDLASGNTTEALLFDGQGNLVAVAAGNGSNGSSVIEFTASSGGDWSAAVANDGSGSYNFNMSITGETGTGMPILEQFFAGQTSSTTEAITIPSNVGDVLQLNLLGLNSPGVQTGLLLFDASGNLVAVASGNASDGTDSVIEFDVPSGEAGNWTAEAITETSSYAYDLSVYGETAGTAYAPTTTTTATPEPASLSMLLLGISGCALLLRRQ